MMGACRVKILSREDAHVKLDESIQRKHKQKENSVYIGLSRLQQTYHQPARLAIG